jgi:hypothetical protein
MVYLVSMSFLSWRTYLYTSIKEDEPQIYMWVDKAVAINLCEVSPMYCQHRRDDGRILVQLKRYLYGLPQAAHQKSSFTNIILTKWNHWDSNQCEEMHAYGSAARET